MARRSQTHTERMDGLVPSIEDYAPDGGNAPVVPPTADDQHKRAANERAMQSIERENRGKGAMLIPAVVLQRPMVYVFPENVLGDDEIEADKVIAQGPWVGLNTRYGVEDYL